jgi:hypothetical protein
MSGESKSNKFSRRIAELERGIVNPELMIRIARERQILNKKITKPRIAARNKTRRACRWLDIDLAAKRRMDITQALFRDLQERLSVGQAAAEAAEAQAAQVAEKRAKKAARAAEKAAWFPPHRLVSEYDDIRGKNGSFLRYQLHRTSGEMRLVNAKNWTDENKKLLEVVLAAARAKKETRVRAAMAPGCEELIA